MIQVVVVDPYHPVAGWLVPTIAKRIHDFAVAHFDESDPDIFTRSVMTRLWAADPLLAVIALVDIDTSTVVGHGVATIEQSGDRRWIFVSQMKADGNVGDAVKRAIMLADEWGSRHGATMMTMSTPRSDAGWRKKYGFEVMRHLMARKIGAVEAGEV